MDPDSSASLRLRAAVTGGASRSPERGRERRGKAGEAERERKGVVASRAAAASGHLTSGSNPPPVPVPPPSLPGKMPLTQGCEEGGEVAAGTARAAAARVL